MSELKWVCYRIGGVSGACSVCEFLNESICGIRWASGAGAPARKQENDLAAIYVEWLLLLWWSPLPVPCLE